MTTQPKPAISEKLKPLLDAAFGAKKDDLISVFEALPEETKENAKDTGVLDLLVYKGFGHEHVGLTQLAKHLLETRQAHPNEMLAKYAAVVGFQCEALLSSVEKVQDDLNRSMSGFGFEEKISITNAPLKGVLDLSACALAMATEEVREAAKAALIEAVPNALQTTKLFESVSFTARPRMRR